MDPTEASQQPAQPENNQIVAFCLLVVCGGVLAKLYLDLHLAGSVASMALVAFAVLGRPFFRFREFFLLSLAVALTLTAIATRPDVVPLVAGALDRAAFLAAFMILLALLRDGAVTSPSVLAVGRYLTRQPPGRRYAALQTGGHFLGVILNFGCLSLLGPLIQRGVRASNEETGGANPDRVKPDNKMPDNAMNARVAAIREQRQITALSRGFSWIVAWSPTTISQAFVPLVLVGVQPLRMAAMGAGITLIFFLAGWLEDRVRGRRIRAELSELGQLPVPNPLPFPKTGFLRFGLVCAVLAAFSTAVVIWSGSAIVPALMLTAPLVTVVWIWLQNRTLEGGWQATLKRGQEIVTRSIPNSSPEALTLSVAGYSGIMAAGLTDAEALAAWIGLDAIPPLAIYLATTAIVPLASNFAIPAMLVVTFLGSLFSALPQLNLDPTLLGFSLIIGWGLNLVGSPFSATSLVLARVTGIPGTTLSWRWNGLYSLISFGISAIFLAVLTSL
ncbi:hypothetical protein [Denitrobaculum tricleocarpae]|uniref:Permease n=1 Tax=Denitrobaculum tricleocarpae TaxID=2591009 RepID=A0A545SSX4_9PROT|nr:hypothetical protein [Denitrobaculum tricleocarpae]TQV68064.1 hypothetical protein FKG95_29240 [Denitrobaculum tricleocarpae]